MNRATLYDKKLILFIDILGFRDYIKKAQNDVMLQQQFVNLMQTLRTDLKIDSNIDFTFESSYFKSESLRITQFSDSIIMSNKYSSSDEFDKLIFDVITIIFSGYYFGFIFRGAITYGDIVHNKETMFGPGFIRAYDLEQKLAVYPRVVIDNIVFNKDIIKMNSSLSDVLIKTDYDGVKYIDPFIGLDYFYKKKKSKEIIIDQITKIIQSGDNTDDLIKVKYNWLKNKFDEYQKNRIDINKFS